MTPHIIFDLGKVLIDWDPELAFLHHFPDRPAVRDWMARVDFDTWNYAQDAGRSFEAGLAVARAALGEDAVPLQDYLDRFPATIADPVPGTWNIANDLKARGHRMFAITNWAQDTWPAALRLYPRLTTLFEDIIVSGIEGMAKPDPAIWRLLLDRRGLAAPDCLFIDDNAANVAAARALTLDAVQFTSAPALIHALQQRGIACTPPAAPV
ncbi:MAG: HAD-IA family hydrolase [Paracoccus sp. (in: a-proteobacteria)]|uniref:HAD-IA family hydrolase n=1 Tax=Paracoccus sp. TaxID=267 RepID=UPI0026DF2998|nr:HAD-IA family hydrolase [Paracoccus sp. (in: a-proteobacteria)]MDO5630861.1 HAD-IA family hydrolase [Paracoccus sp. (in: a-proteobacteria)]